jgi:hypothetical protein
MPQFLCVGERWINVDKITSVEVKDTPKTDEVYCVVRYGNATTSVQLNVEDSKPLLEWLRKHKAE